MTPFRVWLLPAMFATVGAVASAQELPTVPAEGVVLQAAVRPPELPTLTETFLAGDWDEFTSIATQLVQAASNACAPQDVVLNPNCKEDRPHFDLTQDYVHLLWVGKVPTATEPTILSAIIHSPQVEPYSKVLPGLDRRSGHRLFEVFVNDDAPPEVASYYVSKPVADPLLTEAPGVVDKFLGPLFTFFNAVNPAWVRPHSAEGRTKRRYFVLRQVRLPEPRASVEVSISAKVPLAIESMSERVVELKTELAGKGLLTTEALEQRFDEIGTALTEAAQTCRTANELVCRARLHKRLAELAGSIRSNLGTAEEKEAFDKLETAARAFVDSLKATAVTTKLTLDNSPLRHVSFGLLTSVALEIFGDDQRVKVDGGKVVSDPLPRSLNMVVLNFSAGYQAKTSKRIVRGWSAIRGFTGVVFSPDIGVSVGATWAILQNLGVNVGYAHLFIRRPENGLELGSVLDAKVPDEAGNATETFQYAEDLRRDPLRRGSRGALFLGASFNFK